MKTMGWEQRLADYLRNSYAGGFGYGSYDCVMFAAKWVESATEKKVIHPLLKTGITETESSTALSLRPLTTWVSEVMGDPVPIVQARRGDLILRVQGGQEALGICDGLNAHFLLQGSTEVCPTLSGNCSWGVD